MPRFTITTLGCKVNRCESETLARRLKKSGLEGSLVLRDGTDADFCIINTCTVTHKASMQSRQAIRQAVRANPDAYIIVTGCYAQTEPDIIKQINGVDSVMGNDCKNEISEFIVSELKTGRFSEECSCAICHEPGIEPPDVGSRTRFFLKIQDGCDSFCSYCIVPYARGRSRSIQFEKILERINRIKTAGYHEIVLTGIHLGSYGLDLNPKTDFYGLLKLIDESGYMDRVRLSSIEPRELTDDIVKLISESDTFCRHFHVSLQSGDDHILKNMKRPYTGSFFRDLVTKINRLIPDAAIGADLLIGFPGETVAAFENTYSLIDELPVTYLHVFPFSPRKGTPAAEYPGRIDPGVVKDRCRRIRSLGNTKKKMVL